MSERGHSEVPFVALVVFLAAPLLVGLPLALGGAGLVAWVSAFPFWKAALCGAAVVVVAEVAWFAGWAL